LGTARVFFFRRLENLFFGWIPLAAAAAAVPFPADREAMSLLLAWSKKLFLLDRLWFDSADSLRDRGRPGLLSALRSSVALRF
jgi:hypothetical protein